MDIDERLNNCPFCGSKCGFGEDDFGSGLACFVACDNSGCGASMARIGYTSEGGNEPKLIEAWNRRHNTD